MHPGPSGSQLYCTTVQFIIMQVGGGVITVVLYNSSAYHKAGWWRGITVVLYNTSADHNEDWRGDYSCTVKQFSLSQCRLVEGGLKLYCTTVQLIIMQVGVEGIKVVLYNSSADHYAGWRGDYSCTVQQF